MLEILHHVQEPLLHEQWIALGQQIVSDKSQYVVSDKLIIKLETRSDV